MQNPGLADAVIVEDAGDLEFDVFAGFEVSLGEGGPEMIVIGSDGGEGGVEGEGEFVALEHHATVRVGFSSLTELRTEEGVAVEEDGHEAEEDAVFFAEFFDRFVGDVQVKGGFVFTGRAKGEGLKEKVDDFDQPLVADAGGLHQIKHWSQRAFDLLAVKNHIAILIFKRNIFDVLWETGRAPLRGHRP